MCREFAPPITCESRRWQPVCIGLWIALLAGCGAPRNPQLTKSGESTSPADSVRARFTAIKLATASLSYDIPEYDDEQKLLNDTGDGYGPKVGLYALPGASAIDDITLFEGADPVWVAIVEDTVPGDGGKWPTHLATYGNLNLTSATSCVFLRHEPAQSPTDRWTAWIVPLPDNASACKRPSATVDPITKTSLRVHARRDGGAHAVYPKVARFGEAAPRDATKPNETQPLIGVKCAKAWCEIGPDYPTVPHDFQDSKPGHGGAYGDEGNIKGWHDEQRLAVTLGASPTPVVPKLRASVIPVHGLDTFNDAAFSSPSGKHVATVYFKDDPKGTGYDTTWGFTQGKNTIWLQGQGNHWYISIQNSNNSKPVANPKLTVARTSHPDYPVPGTARWHWKENDEGLWVRCAQGCCDIYAQ